MKTLLFPGSIVCIFFVAVWVIRYPEEVIEFMLFRDVGSFADVITGIGIWGFLILAVVGISWLSAILIGK